MYKGGKKAAAARWYAKNRDRERLRMKAYRDKIKDLVFEAYGGYQCTCCGETEKGFLTIDHINDDGAQHRKAIGQRGGIGIYLWLVENHFPPGFEPRCYNCNLGRAHNKGVCPHKEKINMGNWKPNPLGHLEGEIVWNGIIEKGASNAEIDVDSAPSFRAQVPVKEGLAAQDTFKMDASEPTSRAPVELRRMHLAAGEDVGEGSKILKGANMYDEFGGGSGKSAGEFTSNETK
jgi:hypothetical protein